MSVLVKGMKKPNHCMSCPMCNGDDDCVLQDCKDFGTWEDQMKGCPIVELPEKHGRLIDTDRLKETIDYYIREAGWSKRTIEALGWVKDEFIDSEPTVIEADGGNCEAQV